MFGIADFAALAGVTTRRLRLYDKLRLLTPSRIDRATGHRSYSAGQLLRLNQILVLQELGFKLEQIGLMLGSELSVEEFSTLLRSQEAQLSKSLQEQHTRLERVRARLRHIEEEERMLGFDVVEKAVPAARVERVVGRFRRFGNAFGQAPAQLIASSPQC